MMTIQTVALSTTAEGSITLPSATTEVVLTTDGAGVNLRAAASGTNFPMGTNRITLTGRSLSNQVIYFQTASPTLNVYALSTQGPRS